MGQVIRLDTSFNNNNLKKLIDYNYDDIKAQILSLPTLRAFYDATDTSTITFGAGDKVTKINDISGNNLHFNQADILKAPNRSTVAFNGQGGLYFNGSQSMKALNLFSGSQKGSVVIFMQASGATSSSKIVLSDADKDKQAFYGNSGNLIAFSAGVALPVASLPTKLLNYVVAFDASADTATIYADGNSSNGTMSAAGAPSGAGNLGTWTDALSNNNYIGYIGHVMIFDEDLSKNKVVRDLLTEYAKRRYRTDVK